MADNLTPNTPPSKSDAQPPLPSSGTTGRLTSPTTQLPAIRKGKPGKIVVMLSSVAKPPPPAGTQSLPKMAILPSSASRPAPAPTASPAPGAVPLPPKQVAPASQPPESPKLSTTTYVKLPPKTSIPQLTSLTGMPLATPMPKPVPVSKPAPPPLPAKWSEPSRTEPKKSGAQHIPPIKLNELAMQSDAPGESIFTKADPRAIAPAPALKPPEALKKAEPAPVTPAPASPEAKDKPAPLVAPPLLPPTRVEPPKPAASAVPPARPPSFPPSLPKFPEMTGPMPSSFQVAPPMLEKAPELPSEKLAQPNIFPNEPIEARKAEPTPAPPEPAAIHKVPALIQPEASPSNPPPLSPPKPLLPPTPPTAKTTDSPMKQSTPLILSSTSAKLQSPKIAEAKPALKPPTLPKRAIPLPPEVVSETPAPTVETPKSADAPKPVEAPKAPEKLDAAVPTTEPAKPSPVTATPDLAIPLPVKKEAVVASPSASLPKAADVPTPPKSTEPVPLTRAERAKKRRLVSTLIFWCGLVPITGLVLYVGSLYVGRETRIEGQVIPPPGMTLNNEIWLVSGQELWSEASGVADDLARERTPLLEEIQEKQDHVQRAQADVGSREERIRLLQAQIQAHKDEIGTTVKQARDATQQVWDVDGAAIDNEYTSRFNQLQQTIADRAKSLNLKYQPDPAYPSPEVWANAYRLALYQVPAGVDSVKEHQWLADQMKAWRDYEKTLDDRKQQLRDKAAQIKLGPAPKITDLNAKIDELQQRVDSTAAEEVPLKEELQQAQTALATAQAQEAGLDDKYYKQLDTRPEAATTKRIPLRTNGRFSWVDDDPFAEGEKEHNYWLFSRATRPDGRQYWMLIPFSLERNHKTCFLIDPESFISTKAILRPNLSPDEQAQ